MERQSRFGGFNIKVCCYQIEQANNPFLMIVLHMSFILVSIFFLIAIPSIAGYTTVNPFIMLPSPRLRRLSHFRERCIPFPLRLDDLD